MYILVLYGSTEQMNCCFFKQLILLFSVVFMVVFFPQWNPLWNNLEFY